MECRVGYPEIRHALAVKRVGRSHRMSSSSKYSVASTRLSNVSIRGEPLLLTEYVMLDGALNPPRNAVSMRTTPFSCRTIFLLEIIPQVPP